ncbi:hypothetical protein CLAFUW4_01321 [Fulvia fulva]|uniref:Uncharacterized protein n=1 Tax=Passalora fulva TaxID=5499 RepID=A0A9Q8P2A4_PASFU|nr:uncharacterized protein CLAFUR5_01326 [Fulvia fulva]KAK4635950.1 hypothetical protein CLAFUR4_01322 [Fulvia fulva]KAK4638005.1 hypothetical protein CLAFUR0_01323 [Fulvia fulva]UJO10770.1 hypothetical protein CLAFUR5_01326 [Fulvia fulva]WPV10084.1 hypothetical protein CLAFUW4_01321 [Fulvia fulva]WPV24549.1 hypothetical protein CLAFUW7_01326 [Fulvia fulva]
MPASVLYLNAFPGSGKLTIARHLAPLIVSSRILDNHQLIDPVESYCPRGHPKYWDERAKLRQKLLARVKEDPETVYIFTDSRAGYDECVGDYMDLALWPTNRRFYSVVLECDEGENVRRLESEGRKGGKLRDAEVLLEYRRKYHGGIWKFGDEDELVLDVTNLAPAEAARIIFQWWSPREMEGRCRDGEYDL